MPEEFITSHEEQNADTMTSMRQNAAERTPEEAADMLTAGIDALTGKELEENRAFYARMKGVLALRNTVQMNHSNEVHAIARQLYGPLGYDSSPRKIRKM